MMTRRTTSLCDQRPDGFTLVELPVVLVYLEWRRRKRARDKAGTEATREEP